MRRPGGAAAHTSPSEELPRAPQFRNLVLVPRNEALALLVPHKPGRTAALPHGYIGSQEAPQVPRFDRYPLVLAALGLVPGGNVLLDRALVVPALARHRRVPARRGCRQSSLPLIHTQLTPPYDTLVGRKI